MLKRLRHAKRFQTLVKLIVVLLITVLYVTFLYRESLNVYGERSKRSEFALNRDEAPAELLHTIRRQQWQRQQQLRQQTTASSLLDAAPPATAPPPPTTLNPIYEYSEELHSATEKELQRRRAHLQDVCRKQHLQFVYPPRPEEFFISAGHNLVWCPVFKAASSTWLYYFNIMGGYDIRYLQRTERPPLELARKFFPKPDLGELLEALPSSIAFVFVREPFERLVSAYRNKLQGARNRYYKALALKIAREMHDPQSQEAGAGAFRPRGPTFDEFVRYLIREHDAQRPFNEHWAPVYRFCSPCSVDFTIVGKLETFQRDTEFIVRQAGLENLLLGKVPKQRKRKIGNIANGERTDELVGAYFSQIDHHTLDQLLKIYRLDFDLFDYDYGKYYDYVQTPMDIRPATGNAMTVAMASDGTTTGSTNFTRQHP